MSLRECLFKAQNYCAKAEHCRREVTAKLWQWKVPQEWHERIIADLSSDGYIDEIRYSRAFVHDKQAYNGWGRRRLEMQLAALGIDDGVIQLALQQIDEDEYRRIMLKLLKQKSGQPKEKVIRFMLQRGFTYDEIKEYL